MKDRSLPRNKGIAAARKQKKREQAWERQEDSMLRSDEERLARLTKNGHTHCHEYRELLAKVKADGA